MVNGYTATAGLACRCHLNVVSLPTLELKLRRDVVCHTSATVFPMGRMFEHKSALTAATNIYFKR